MATHDVDVVAATGSSGRATAGPYETARPAATLPEHGSVHALPYFRPVREAPEGF
ncbi:hypothetical protein ACIQXD_32295 [Streptomyces uncialis]|uniref:hypothetical protein n=1 Tax=Streptomyces uncialis TaxID=1048205 RepID=UPI0038273A10